jgi:hypothetical protein
MQMNKAAGARLFRTLCQRQFLKAQANTESTDTGLMFVEGRLLNGLAVSEYYTLMLGFHIEHEKQRASSLSLTIL